MSEVEEELSPAQRVPALRDVVQGLATKKMLPAIVFIFSRAGCDEAARKSEGVPLASPDEKEVIKSAVDALRYGHSRITVPLLPPLLPSVV